MTQGTWTTGSAVVYSQGTWTISPGHLEGADSPSALPACPECSAELADLEQRTQFPDIPCGTGAGTLRLRTVCNMQGFNSQTIYVPDGHDADCFHIEAQTGGQATFAIYPESNPNNIIYSSQRDGLDRLGAVHLSDTGVYRIDLDLAAADPESRVSIGCVTHPE
ncbi:MAG: hypothetical protein IT369_02140 [Candidatus Latescibacteria bacterium]|nr:hypothetical protein [Candidatus Latescibacterota bacterium]